MNNGILLCRLKHALLGTATGTNIQGALLSCGGLIGWCTVVRRCPQRDMTWHVIYVNQTMLAQARSWATACCLWVSAPNLVLEKAVYNFWEPPPEVGREFRRIMCAAPHNLPSACQTSHRPTTWTYRGCLLDRILKRLVQVMGAEVKKQQHTDVYCGEKSGKKAKVDARALRTSGTKLYVCLLLNIDNLWISIPSFKQ